MRACVRASERERASARVCVPLRAYGARVFRRSCVRTECLGVLSMARVVQIHSQHRGRQAPDKIINQSECAAETTVVRQLTRLAAGSTVARCCCCQELVPSATFLLSLSFAFLLWFLFMSVFLASNSAPERRATWCLWGIYIMRRRFAASSPRMCEETLTMLTLPVVPWRP